MLKNAQLGWFLSNIECFGWCDHLFLTPQGSVGRCGPTAVIFISPVAANLSSVSAGGVTLYVRNLYYSYWLGRSSYGSIKQHSIPLGCLQLHMLMFSAGLKASSFYSLLDMFLMGFVARTMWCGATNTPLWPFCPLTCMNSSSERRIFSSYLLWFCRFVEFFCDTKIHAANLSLNTQAHEEYLTSTFFSPVWIL